MEIADIAYLGTHIEMRKEVLRYAINNNLEEEEVWNLVNAYRKIQQMKGARHTPARVKEVLQTVVTKLDPKIRESPIEDLLQTEMAIKALYPEREYKISKLNVDFCFPKDKLIIEVDGKNYHSSPQQKENDEKRDKFLMKKGYTVLRFPGKQVYRDPKSCITRITKFLNRSPP